MPGAHEAHVHDVAHARAGQAAFEPLVPGGGADEPHEHEVAQPERQRDVPAVPEVLDVDGGERRAEVARRADAEAVAGAHGHHRVAGEVEEHEQAERPRVLHLLGRLGKRRARPHGSRRVPPARDGG